LKRWNDSKKSGHRAGVDGHHDAGMDGLEAMRRIRQDTRLQAAIIAVTIKP
jgi:CheY-like chemotaxis protein